MNKGIGISILVVSCLGLISVGALINTTGGVTIRTNIAPDTVALTVFDPLLPGVAVRPTWTVAKNSPAKEVELVLATQAKDYVLTRTKFVFGNTRVTIPCDVIPGSARLELVGQQDRDIISAVGVEILPPGPDCVR